MGGPRNATSNVGIEAFEAVNQPLFEEETGN